MEPTYSPSHRTLRTRSLVLFISLYPSSRSRCFASWSTTLAARVFGLPRPSSQDIHPSSRSKQPFSVVASHPTQPSPLASHPPVPYPLEVQPHHQIRESCSSPLVLARDEREQVLVLHLSGRRRGTELRRGRCSGVEKGDGVEEFGGRGLRTKSKEKNGTSVSEKIEEEGKGKGVGVETNLERRLQLSKLGDDLVLLQLLCL